MKILGYIPGSQTPLSDPSSSPNLREIPLRSKSLLESSELKSVVNRPRLQLELPHVPLMLPRSIKSRELAKRRISNDDRLHVMSVREKPREDHLNDVKKKRGSSLGQRPKAFPAQSVPKNVESKQGCQEAEIDYRALYYEEKQKVLELQETVNKLVGQNLTIRKARLEMIEQYEGIINKLSNLSAMRIEHLNAQVTSKVSPKIEVNVKPDVTTPATMGSSFYMACNARCDFHCRSPCLSMITPSTNVKSNTPINKPFETSNSISSSHLKDTKRFEKLKPLASSIYRMRTYEHNQGSIMTPSRANESTSIFEGLDKRHRTSGVRSGTQTDRGKQTVGAPKPSQQADQNKHDQQKHRN